MKMPSLPTPRSPRGMVLGVLGLVTLGVAVLSIAVSYTILEPRFGVWAVPTVAALDALWLVFQAAEILAGNNTARARRVQLAGMALTVINAAIPTVDLIVNRLHGFDLAVVITPVAILATKVAWWIALPSLGRRVSAGTQTRLDEERQKVADQLEEMEAQAANRIEFLKLAAALEERVADAAAGYREAALRAQQAEAEALHKQSEATSATLAEKQVPASVTRIALPELGEWSPDPSTHAVAALGSRDTTGTQVNALPPGTGTPGGTDPGTPARPAAQLDGLDDLAMVAGVPTPVPAEPLTDEQIDVVLRCLRYTDDPPASYRQAREGYRRAGFVGSEERVRHGWTRLMEREEVGGEASEDADADEDAESDA
ncbi:spdB2-like protein (plasmid) [Streptomyces sp. PVA_94-07]|uniref:spdB2-like protein n=1 Tax=Streptomyces sp. PVA_94-07 TaxID=1225337 RepID=UPI0003C2E18F|nr:spdB2-like protein [Streptomyces sp. PVA_94-07]ESQ01818.1 spdB2-like protein [Streptomyces sp. PVA_94-07]